MIITEPTPNPDSLKFLSEKKLSSIGTEEFQKKNIGSIKNKFVASILNLKGVELVLISEHFMSVNKAKNTKWEDLKPSVIAHINDYFEKNNEPILNQNQTNKGQKLSNNEIESRIIKVLDTKIRPAVARDGGDIKFKSFKDGVVQVELQGSCSGCPSSLMTLKQGVQNLLCHYVEEVKSVEAI